MHIPTNEIATTSSSSLAAAAAVVDYTAGTVSLSSSSLSALEVVTPPPVLLIVIIAVLLLVSAQSFINTMLTGEQGLSAYLKDGSGYNKSGYQPRRSARATDQGSTNGNNKTEEDAGPTSEDPLPWLKLPALKFVDVAGQQQQQQPAFDDNIVMNENEEERTVSNEVYNELERLRLKLNIELSNNNNKNKNDGNDGGKENYNLSEEAIRIRTKMERLMKIYGIEYTID